MVPTSVCSIIGMCDGSEKGYAATLFLRSASADEKDIQISLLKARSKVSPLKTLSICRIELMGAVLLSRVLLSIQDFVKRLDVIEVLLFSDSSVVLGWLRTPPHRLRTYVANRVVEILDNTNPSSWHHISSEENSADCASRGLLPDDLVDHHLWWKGPSFLSEPRDTWSLTSSNSLSAPENLVIV